MKCGPVLIICLFLLVLKSSGNQTESAKDVFIAHEESLARAWLQSANIKLRELVRMYKLGIWNYATNITEETKQQKLENDEKFELGVKELAKEQKRFLHSTAFKDKDLQRELSFYTVPTMSILSPEKYLEFKKILLDMEYLTSNFTRHETNDLAVWANWWREYYDKKSTPKRSNYKRYLELKREAANLHGLESPWHAWLNKYGGASFDDQLDAMIPQFMPLYEQLHAYTRFKLRIKYGETVVPEKGLIPLHIVGHLEGPHFLGIKDLLQPYPDYNDDGEVLKAMMRRNYTPRSLYERADEFFHSLNFSKVPDQFWNNSILERPTDGRNMFCGAPSSWSFEVTDDVRTIHCSDLSKVNLNIAHHEMGHIQYYLQSQHLPVVFHSAANQAIGEAVGDTIYLSASRPKHLARIGLLRSDLNDEKVKINHLMEMALDKIVGLFSCYATDQYRKELFLQTTTVEDNCRYWQLRDKYGGVEPPVERSNADFDVAVSQHVSADRDYLKYIVGFITQFQFHKGLCETAGEYVTGDPEKTLNNCDIYGSVAAGKILKKMMSMGASKPWPDVMEVITGQRNIDAGPMLEYFRPLHEWLEKMNRRNKAFVGWTSSKKCRGGGPVEPLEPVDGQKSPKLGSFATRNSFEIVVLSTCILFSNYISRL